MCKCSHVAQSPVLKGFVTSSECPYSCDVYQGQVSGICDTALPADTIVAPCEMQASPSLETMR